MPIVIGLGEGGIDNEWSDPLGLLGGKSPEASTSTTKASEPIEAPAAASSSTKTAPDASAAVESQG